VFVGYGITAKNDKDGKPIEYDDYANIDVRGKVALALRFEPVDAAGRSLLTNDGWSDHASLVNKAKLAAEHGAVALLIVHPPTHHGPDLLASISRRFGDRPAAIPVVHIKQYVADHLFEAAGAGELKSYQSSIDESLKPKSFALNKVTVSGGVALNRNNYQLNNVQAFLPAKGKKAKQYIVVGAHYDHLGLGEQHSLAPSQAGTVHPGADDNASGTAGVIEMARWYSKQPKQKRGILFLTFAGEELGLLGSAYYVEHPELPLEKAVAMLNMDMIGRIRNDKVYIGGSATGSTFRAMLDELTPQSAVKVDYSDGPQAGSSDHTSFIGKRIPSLFFFSGLHTDYHKPSDTWDKIDSAAAAKLLALVAGVTDHLRSDAGRPEFVRVAPASSHGGGDAGPVSASSGSGYGPWFGSVPDFAEGIKGVKFSDVTPGSPAAKAGLKGGDIMVEFDGKPIQNLYDFTYALRAKKPGDEVKVKVMRDGQAVEQNVLLTARP